MPHVVDQLATRRGKAGMRVIHSQLCHGLEYGFEGFFRSNLPKLGVVMVQGSGSVVAGERPLKVIEPSAAPNESVDEESGGANGSSGGRENP